MPSRTVYAINLEALYVEAINSEAGIIIAHHISKFGKITSKDDPFQFLSGASSLSYCNCWFVVVHHRIFWRAAHDRQADMRY